MHASPKQLRCIALRLRRAPHVAMRRVSRCDLQAQDYAVVVGRLAGVCGRQSGQRRGARNTLEPFGHERATRYIVTISMRAASCRRSGWIGKLISFLARLTDLQLGDLTVV
jgi:hypothetical protein